MRVIAGTARRLQLKSIEGRDTRPTTDRIKETLFNMLQPDLAGSHFLDLFAGSGQIGIEALSRGADYAVFVESGKKACACVQENIRITHMESKAKLFSMEALRALHTMEKKYTFDFIFMDPPYQSSYEKDVLAYLSDSGLVRESTLVIAEAAARTDFSYVRELGFLVAKEKNYKTNKHIFMTKEAYYEKSDLSGQL